MIAKVKATNSNALVCINTLPSPDSTGSTPQEYRSDFKDFFSDLQQSGNVDIVSYHFPYLIAIVEPKILIICFPFMTQILEKILPWW